LIAGKGHEDYQLVGDKVLDFDDVGVARSFLETRSVMEGAA
jgi:UDP-N-acetylmuramoyl-L-alanyl-D-glutamate--2,6-diaminopimelate ligase